jgi:hypothetical protein
MTADRWLACCTLVATVALGCEKPQDAIKRLDAQYRAAIEQNLAAWPAIAEQVRSLPPLHKDGLDGNHPFIVDALADRTQTPTASLCYAEDLAAPDKLGYVWGRIETTGTLNQCASLLRNGRHAYDPGQTGVHVKGISQAETETLYPRCAGYRYLLVIRTLEWLPPTTATRAAGPFQPVLSTIDLNAPPPAEAPVGPARAKGRPTPETRPTVPAPIRGAMVMPESTTGYRHVTRHTFAGGYERGEILVFALPSAKLLGGFRFAAQNHVEIDGKAAAVDLDLQRQVAMAIRGALQTAPATAGQAGPE